MIKTISIKNISQSFLEKNILDQVSFKVTAHERMCIVGDNGTGKSTLLKIIVGEIEPTAGSIEHNGHIRCYYVPQEFTPENAALTIEAYIQKHGSVTLYKKIFAVGQSLGYNLEKNMHMQCALLSGGQQKVLALSVGIANAPDFLLLDEPENHLDIVSRLELMVQLQEYRGGILFVSHDRLMIDSVATKVAEVATKKVYISEGTYEDYIENRLTRIAGLQRSFDTDTKRIKQLQTMLPILAQKAYRGKDVPTYLKRKEELRLLKEKQADSPRADDTRTKIKLAHSGSALHNGKLLCRITDATFGYDKGGSDIFRDISVDVRIGQHIVLLGRNGSGKSTFLKALTGNVSLTRGSIAWSPDITTSYFDQHAVFDPGQTPVEIVVEALACDDNKARAHLGAMKFTKEKMETMVGELSGGERMRLRFALVFGSKPDVIILDEPTNHLDEVTWQILLDACNATTSTILLVTHDYEFIENLESKLFWLIKNHVLRERYKDLKDIIEELR